MKKKRKREVRTIRNRNKTKKYSNKTQKNKWPLYMGTGIAVIVAAAAVFWSAENGTAPSENQQNGPEISASAERLAGDNAQKIVAGESLVIPVADQSSTVNFYPIEIDGVSMEVLAVRDDDGNVRTAFNTCQICYGSGRGYYRQQGDVLVCQNCGNHFTIDQVEIESGGCNPWPIFPENKTVTDESISISYDFLKESNRIFSNWKVTY